MRRNLAICAITLGLLVGSLALFQFTDLDVRLQDHFYDFTRQKWMVNKQAAAARILFYDGPKVVIGVLAAALLIGATVPVRRLPRWFRQPWPRLRVWCVLVCLAVVPTTIGLMKAYSDLYCPWSIERYGGMQPHRHLFDPLPPGEKPDCGRCFPAGHASGGFAVMSLGLLFNQRRNRWLGWVAGMVCGWAMGGYQMLKGAHFLSHTVTTMLLAILLIHLVALLFRIDPRQNATVPTGG